MTDVQQPGPDLARQILRQVKAAALERGAAPKPVKKVRRRAPRGGGREPAAFGDVLEGLAVANGWNRPSAGGTVMSAWPRLMGDDARHALPDRYDADTRTLYLRPASPSARTWLHLHTVQVTARLNAAVGEGTIDRLVLLAPGPARTTPDAIGSSAPVPVLEELPARTRAQAPPGYHRALDAAVAGRRPAAAHPQQALADQYFADTRHTLREPAETFADSRAHLEEPLPTGGNESEEARQRALQRRQDERTGRAVYAPQALDRTA